MPITDLTGTNWLISSNPTITSGYGRFYLTFAGEDYSDYDGIAVGYKKSSYMGGGDFVAGNNVFFIGDAGGISSVEGALITITGGTDVTNANLIAWLEANATQLPVTDLTGCTWVGKNSVYVGSAAGNTFAVNFTDANSASHSEIQFTARYALYDGSVVYDDTADSWKQTYYKTITFTGGTDATNSTLIAWLEANGTLTAPQPVKNTYELTHSLTNLTHSNITLQITPDTGYTYPTTLTVTNGTLVSYDNTTGVAVISGDDTTTVSGECIAEAGGYSGDIDVYQDAMVGSTYIKFDSAPANEDDYDSCVESGFGELKGLTSYTNKTKVYVWGDQSTVKINNIETTGGDSYSNAVEITLNGNYAIYLRYGRIF